MKVYSIREGNIIVSLINRLIDIYKVNSNVVVYDRQQMLEQYVTFTEYLFKIGFSFYALSTMGYFLFPLYFYKTRNEINPLVPSYLPGVDENTKIGFIILFIFHLNIIAFGFIGSSCTDFNFTMIIVNVPVLANIIGDNIKELNYMLREQQPKRVMIKAKFRNMLLQHQEFLK